MNVRAEHNRDQLMPILIRIGQSIERLRDAEDCVVLELQLTRQLDKNCTCESIMARDIGLCNIQ